MRTTASTIGRSLTLFIFVGLCSLIPLVRDSELRLGDTLFRLAPPPPHRSAVVLVLIDDKSLREYGRWPWSRDVLSKLLDGISRNGAEVIGLDVLLSEPQSRDADASLERSLKNGRTVIVGKVSGLADGPQWIAPLPAFAQAATAVGHAHAVLDEDSVCRRFPPLELTIDGPRWGFAVEVARLVDPTRASAFLKFYGVANQDSAGAMTLARPILVRIPFRRDEFDSVSAATVLRGEDLKAKLGGRPVLVGFGAAELSDRLSTPLATELPAPGIEVHAQILDGILTGRWLKDTPIGANVLLLALTCWLVVSVFQKWHGWSAAAWLVALAAAVYAFSFLWFLWGSRIIPAGSMMLAVAAGPVLVYAADFALVERSLTRQLAALRSWLADRGPQSSLPAKSDFSWKLALLQRLGTELGSLYELHQTLLESTQDLVAIFDEKGRLLLHNRAFAATLGTPDPAFTLEQLRARWVQEPDAPLIASGDGKEGEVHVLERLYSARIVPLPPTRLSPGGGTVVTLTSLQTRVERDRARSEALAFITHELRTPLSSIQGFADLMIRYPGSPDCEGAPETILWESKRLLALINSYLDVLRLDAGAKPLAADFLDLHDSVRQVFEILRPLAAAANMGLILQTDGAVVTTGDANLINGAVLNLVSNAIKYGKGGTDIVVSCAHSITEVVIGVRNQGKVIATGDIPHLFDPYYRSRDVDSAKPGWGLGLAFVQRIAEKHGGNVQVKSDGSGTLFEIHLPAKAGSGHPMEVTE